MLLDNRLLSKNNWFYSDLLYSGCLEHGETTRHQLFLFLLIGNLYVSLCSALFICLVGEIFHADHATDSDPDSAGSFRTKGSLISID